MKRCHGLVVCRKDVYFKVYFISWTAYFIESELRTVENNEVNLKDGGDLVRSILIFDFTSWYILPSVRIRKLKISELYLKSGYFCKFQGNEEKHEFLAKLPKFCMVYAREVIFFA